MLEKILPAAKAWCALIGALSTALLGTLTPDDPAFRVLTIVVALATAVVVFSVPNADGD